MALSPFAVDEPKRKAKQLICRSDLPAIEHPAPSRIDGDAGWTVNELDSSLLIHS